MGRALMWSGTSSTLDLVRHLLVQLLDTWSTGKDSSLVEDYWWFFFKIQRLLLHLLILATSRGSVRRIFEIQARVLTLMSLTALQMLKWETLVSLAMHQMVWTGLQGILLLIMPSRWLVTTVGAKQNLVIFGTFLGSKYRTLH